ncbi:hypothetical protein QTP88_026181 [Uroleucon formosanum]
MLQGVLADNGLDVMKCIGNATDAAANMQGQFNGFSAWLEKSTPNQVHVWCYSHILNLVIIDSTKSPLKAAALFVTLNDLANYFKESYKRKNVWVNFVGENNKKRLQSISNTRWWSKEVALKHIFGSDVELTNKIKRFDETITRDSLQNELLSFASNWNELKKSVPESYEVVTFNEIQDEEDVENKTMNKTHCKSCMNCSICCYLVLQKYNLFSNAYSHLTMAYKYLLTLSCTQVACERLFSILKYLKNRLRSTLNESKLEAFMIMSIEKDTLFKINTDEVIDQLKTKSNLLSRELSY